MNTEFNLTAETLKDLRKALKTAKQDYKDANLKLSPLYKEVCKKTGNKGLLGFLESIGFNREMTFKDFKSFLGAEFLTDKKGQEIQYFTFNKVVDRIFDIFYYMHETEVMRTERLEKEAKKVAKKAAKDAENTIKAELYEKYLKIQEAKKQVEKINNRLTAVNAQKEQFTAENNKTELKKVNGQIKSLKASLKENEAILKAS